MTAIGALCGFILSIGMHYPGQLSGVLMVVILLSGLLGTCRLYLNKHTPAQVYAGFLLGFGFITGILW